MTLIPGMLWSVLNYKKKREKSYLKIAKNNIYKKH